jgi:predicted N-acetyltransferase YhbS
MDIRNTIEADEPEIRRVHEAAFGPQDKRDKRDKRDVHSYISMPLECD